MKQIKWFDRKFEFSFEQNIFPSIIERLEGTPIRLNHKINQIATEYLLVKPEGKWAGRGGLAWGVAKVYSVSFEPLC